MFEPQLNLPALMQVATKWRHTSHLLMKRKVFEYVYGGCYVDLQVTSPHISRNMSSPNEVGPSEHRKTDPGWKYNFLVDPNDKNTVTCKFCKKVTKGGIFRAKAHQIGGNRNVRACNLCPKEVKEELTAYQNKQKLKKTNEGLFDVGNEEMEDEEVLEIPNPENKRKKINVKGPMDLYMNKGKGKKVQTSIHDACDKEIRGKTIQAIAAFFYQAGIAFNVANMDCFKEMIAAVGSYGRHLRPPSYHELRVPLLRNEVQSVQQWVEGHKSEWAKFGCSIMSDGWTDRRQRTLINFLVNGAKGTVFMESVDASSYMKTGDKVFELFDRFVQKVGEENVVQIITDNGSNFKAAGKKLMATYGNLYWTPCAAHCLDLMLEDIGKIAKVKKTIQKGIFLVGYIYNHTVVLNMMREFTKNSELTKAGVTRFATTYLTLKSIQKQKSALRNMFASEKWSKGKWAEEVKGKRANDIVFTPSFWNNVTFVLKVMGPLVEVLRIVDNEKKPAMGYIYEAMERAKLTIKAALGKDNDEYNLVSDIIDKRWDCTLHHPLHAVGYYFNPEFYCVNEDIENDREVSVGLHECISRLVSSKVKKELIMTEMIQWVNQTGFFGLEVAKLQRGKIAPAEWWKLYGKGTPNLAQLAIKVLSLTCSASGCERNWSTFEHIHSKKRNRLEHQKLHDLVYVKYNKMLQHRKDANVAYDPIELDDIDDSNEWLVGEMDEDRVFDDDGNLTWTLVGEASGAGEERRTRAKSSNATTSNVTNKRKLVDEDSDEEMMNESGDPLVYEIDDGSDDSDA